MRYPILFAMLTGLWWGMYGTALAEARAQLASPFKPYFFIGVAYLIWGIVGGGLGIRFTGASFTASNAGIVWSMAAGTLGAWGALCLTLAMFSGGTAMPQVVMPVVFGSAVTVSALVAFAQQREASPLMWIGIAIIFVGVVLVAYNTPHGAPPGSGHTAAVSEGSR